MKYAARTYDGNALYKHLPTSCDRLGSPRNRPGRSLHIDE